MLLGAFLGFVAAVTVAVAGWLFWVIRIILPQQDPDRIPFWTAVAFAFLGYGVLTWIYLMTKRVLVFRVALGVASLIAIACGAYAITTEMMRIGWGLEYEGYLMVIGLVLAAHGALLFPHTIRTRHRRRRTRSA